MRKSTVEQFVQISNEPKLLENTIEYLAEHLGKFLKPQEKVVLAFREHKEGNISWLMEQAALRIGVVPVIWGPDHRWNTLLRQTFQSHASAVIGSPLVILGLTKLKRQFNTPLPIRKVVTVGYPCLDWVIEGIVKGLDCEVGGCFSVDEEGIVAGFACGHSLGVHVREDAYGVDIVDDAGNSMAAGELGQIVLYPKSDPTVRLRLGDLGRIAAEECPCGCKAAIVTDMQLGSNVDPDLYVLAQELHKWTSILDCYLAKSDFGLEVEIVCFPGEKLPALPSAAKLMIKYYNPKTDEPTWFYPDRLDAGFFRNFHKND
jgi:hypothetical protein